MEAEVGVKYKTIIMPGDEPVVTVQKITPKRVYYTGDLEGYCTKEKFAADFTKVVPETVVEGGQRAGKATTIKLMEAGLTLEEAKGAVARGVPGIIIGMDLAKEGSDTTVTSIVKGRPKPGDAGYNQYALDTIARAIDFSATFGVSSPSKLREALFPPVHRNPKSNITALEALRAVKEGKKIGMLFAEDYSELERRVLAMVPPKLRLDWRAITEGIPHGTTTGRISANQPQEASTPREKQPWDGEPDQLRFKHNGLVCLVLRNHELGSLCGYVKLPHGKVRDAVRNHQKVLAKKITSGLFRKASKMSKRRGKIGYDSPILNTVEVHGGLTYSGSIGHYLASRGTWIGFDCAHFTDLVPVIHTVMRGRSLERETTIYRTIEFCAANCKSLADQIKALS